MKCPNCGGEIGRFELAPDCKHCGANIFYSQQEKLLAEDAKRCELEFASFRILKAKLKSAFIGGPIRIMRLVAMLIAIGFIFIPVVTLSVELSLFSSKISLGAFGVYQAVSGGELKVFLNLAEYIPEFFGAFAALAVIFVLIFLMGLGVFIALVLSFLNLNRSAKVCCGFSVAGIALSVAACVLSVLMPSIAEPTFISAKTGFGAFALLAVFVLIFALNFITLKKNFQPDISETDLKRVETMKKIKAGEITFADLPLPVFESEEEREKRLEEERKEAELNG